MLQKIADIIYWHVFLTTRFFVVLGVLVLAFIAAFLLPGLYPLVSILGWVFWVLVFIDFIFLYFLAKKPTAKRVTGERMSNGDENSIELQIRSRSAFTVDVDIIDELPVQFQRRDWQMSVRLTPNSQRSVVYTLRPVERGEYHFGKIILYIKSMLGLLRRRHDAGEEQTVAVYPSYIQLRKFTQLAGATIQSEHGTKRMRKIGHSMEFEQIKEYVRGDDIRTINWKATARKGGLMVNNYSDEKSQQVYCVIDKGRLMKMPFNELTLLDYAINSSLVMANVCLQKQDRIGLITFANKMGAVLAADRKPVQREHILQLLYNQETAFLESDYEMLYMQVRNRIKHRSLLILYTNFESLSGLHRQLPYLRSIARYHLLVVVFFENTELHQLSKLNVNNVEDIYVKTIAEKFEFDKRLIVKELKKYGIHAILTPPEELTVNTVNKYLELKARQAI